MLHLQVKVFPAKNFSKKCVLQVIIPGKNITTSKLKLVLFTLKKSLNGTPLKEAMAGYY